MVRESEFQSEVIKDLKKTFDGCVVLKNDPNYLQGFPDLLVLYKDKWAALECKRSEKAPKQSNQAYYVNRLNRMSYSNFIYPENKEEVFDELQQALRH